ncbi:hypothetical protein [Aurantibacter sp.]|uniref:hypothetical protein n=1 Tax=Aurantibacter sp. TaxID=2807103 RepID=UPI0035C874B9
MTQYQEQRLNRLNYQIEQLHLYKKSIKKVTGVIAKIVLIVISIVIINYFLSTNISKTTVYQNITIGTFSVIGLIAINYSVSHFKTQYNLKLLIKEKQLILDIIEKQKRDFKRFEKFEEIGKEENTN